MEGNETISKIVNLVGKLFGFAVVFCVGWTVMDTTIDAMNSIADETQDMMIEPPEQQEQLEPPKQQEQTDSISLNSSITDKVYEYNVQFNSTTSLTLDYIE